MSFPQISRFLLVPSHFTKMTKSTQNENNMTKSMSLINRWYWNHSIKNDKMTLILTNFGVESNSHIHVGQSVQLSPHPSAHVLPNEAFYSSGNLVYLFLPFFRENTNIPSIFCDMMQNHYFCHSIWLFFAIATMANTPKSPGKSYMVAGIYRYI